MCLELRSQYFENIPHLYHDMYCIKDALAVNGHITHRKEQNKTRKCDDKITGI